jgi:hypothetical protein
MRPAKPAPNRQTPDAQGLSLAARMGYLQVMRAGLAAVVLASAAFAAHLVGATFRSLAVATGAYALIAASGEAIRRRVRRRGLWIIGGLLLVDGLYLAWVMFLTGGTQSPLRFLVYVQLIAVTLLASYRTGLKVALWHTLLLFVVLYAQAAGLLQPVDAAEPSVGGETFGESVVFNVMAFWLVALGTAAFSAVNERELRRRKADLEALAGMATGLDNASDPAGIARILLDSLGEAFGFKRGVVLGASHGDLRLLAQMGLSEPAEERTGPDSVVKQAWDKRRPVLVKQLDPGRDPQLTPWVCWRSRTPAGSGPSSSAGSCRCSGSSGRTQRWRCGTRGCSRRSRRWRRPIRSPAWPTAARSRRSSSESSPERSGEAPRSAW